MKCDLCGGDPQCVKYCEFGALEFVDADEVAYIKRKTGADKLAEALKRIGTQLSGWHLGDKQWHELHILCISSGQRANHS